MLRPWELNVAIERESAMAIHVQIAQQIISDIQNGRFTAGTALPGTRDLAKKIKVNRKTIIQAYEELVAQGWLVCENKRGTFISSKASSIKPGTATKSVSLAFSTEPIASNSNQTADRIALNADLADDRLIPFEMIARAMRHALIMCARQTPCNVNDAKGNLNLRLALMHMLNAERGLHANAEEICTLASSQMGLYVIAKTITQVNDFVVLEQLSNPRAREAFADCGANILNVAHDHDGIDMANLELLCVQYKIRAVYVTPHHQIPTTIRMSAQRRLALLQLAIQYDFLIIEEDAGHEYNFNNSSSLAISSSTQSKHLIYLGSLNKIFGASLDLGYLVANKAMIALCADRIRLIDGQADPVKQMTITELLNNGEIKRHRARTLKVYQARQAGMIALIEDELAEFVSFRAPESGLAIWLEVKPWIDMVRLQADATSEKISLSLASDYASSKHPISAIRLGYAHLSIAEMTQGIQRLKAALISQQLKLLRA